MDSETFILMLEDKLPRNDPLAIDLLRQRLDKLDEKQLDDIAFKISMIKLKSPALVFWVGSFFFGGLGIGRFMIGDVLLGSLKLLLFILYMFFLYCCCCCYCDRK